MHKQERKEKHMEGIEKTNFVTYKTTNYDIFKTLKGNRQLNELNVKSIVKSIEENGLLPSVAIVNEKMEVIDGQHRIEAMRRTENPVYFQIREGYSLKDCIALNVASRNWTAMDYIVSYAEQGNPNYERLKKAIETYKEVPSTVIIRVCASTNNGAPHSRDMGAKIKTGAYACADDREIKQKLKLLVTASPYIEKTIKGRKQYVYISLANLALLNNIDAGRIMEQLKKQYVYDKPVAALDDALDYWFEVYNYRKKVKVRFIDDYKNTFGK